MNKSLLGLTFLLASSTLVTAEQLRLIEAAKLQDIESVRLILKNKENINQQHPDGSTALHWAVLRDNLELADMLIQSGANVNQPDQVGATPLWVATYIGSPALVNSLLKAGANPNLPLALGETPLMTAASIGSLEIVNALLSAGADANAKEEKRGQTALMWAVAEGHTDTARALIDHGASIRERSKGGFTPLLFASLNGNLDAAELLVSMDADINETANDSSSPLLIAAAGGHDKLTQYLVENGADPSDTDYKGFTALHYAAMNRNMLGSARSLLANGADPNARIVRSDAGHELLAIPDLPFLESPTRIVQVDTKGGTYPTGATPLYLAAQQRNAAAMRLLVENGANLEARTTETVYFMGGSGRRVNYVAKNTPLMAAAGIDRVIDNWNELTQAQERQALDAVQAAIEMGADVNATNEYGMTSIHAATFIGADTIVEYLLKNGANPDVKDVFGQTPISISEQVITAELGDHFDVRPRRSYPELTSMLLDMGATPLEESGVVARSRVVD
jgi:ankyrin repeat protein